MADPESTAPQYTYQHIPQEMRQYPQWILFKRVWKPEKGKWDKVPTQVTGQPASITNRTHFASYEQAVFAHQMGVGDGIGFCFTLDDPFVFLDLDQSIVDNQWRPEHLHIMQMFPTWGELSQSGKGVHLISQGTLDRARILHQEGIELYSSGRFVAMTGWHLQGWPEQVLPVPESIQQLTEYIDSAKASRGTDLTDAGPVPELIAYPEPHTLPVSRDVLSMILEGDASKWGDDRSAALLACSMSLYRAGLEDGQVLGLLWDYCGHIAQEHRPQGDAKEWLWKYCVAKGRSARPPDATQLFEAIPTAAPDKLQAIMEKVNKLAPNNIADATAIKGAREILAESLELDAASRIAVKDAIAKTMTWTKGEMSEIMKEIDRERRRLQQGESGGLQGVLDGYLYVANLHAFYHKESGELLKPEAFVALHTHLSQELREIVLAGGGVAKVTGIDFDPAQPEFFWRHGGLYFNTWRGLEAYGKAGDITPWWNHLCLLVPDETERNHLINWMAFTLQQPHVKINHCIVMGGSPGIGKDTLFWPLSQALGRHAKQVGADALLRDFNDFFTEAKLVTIQEVDLGSRREARVVANRMKPYIASPPDTLHINPKGTKAFHIQNVVHEILYSNEHHPVLIDDGDRRYFVLTSDLRVTNRAGYQKQEWRDYFAGLWYWMDTQKGWEAVVHWLLSWDVTQFNPKAAPPMTEAKLEIMEQGRTVAETLIYDCIDNAAGPLQYSIVSAEEVTLWLQHEGTAFLTMHGVKETPSKTYVGRGLTSAGGVQRRFTIGGKQKRFYIVRNHEELEKKSSQQLLKYMEKERNQPAAKVYAN